MLVLEAFDEAKVPILQGFISYIGKITNPCPVLILCFKNKSEDCCLVGYHPQILQVAS
jgi:hypothetical protein